MGNTPTRSFRVGQFVLAKFDAGEQFYHGKIVRVHSEYAYDVEFFHSGRILTKQWNDIKPDPSHGPLKMKSPTVATKRENLEITTKGDTWQLWKSVLESHGNDTNNSGLSYTLGNGKQGVTRRNSKNSFDAVAKNSIIAENKENTESNNNNNNNEERKNNELNNVTSTNATTNENEKEKEKEKEKGKNDENSNENESKTKNDTACASTLSSASNMDGNEKNNVNNNMKDESIESMDSMENDLLANFDQLIAKYKTIEINLDSFNGNNNNNDDANNNKNDNNDNNNNNNNNNKISGEMVDNFCQILEKVGGNELQTGLIDCYKSDVNDRIKNAFLKSDIKNENVRKLLDLTINECDKDKLSFDLRMDLDYNKTIKSNEENEKQFRENIKKEISNSLNINESLIMIDEIKAGSVIVTVIIISGIIPLILAGLFLLKTLWFKSDTKLDNKGEKNKEEAQDDDSMKGETFTCNVGDMIQVRYKNALYDAKVLEIRQTINKDTTIKIEYDKKPFAFINTEVLAMNSDRIEAYPEPGATCAPTTQLYGQLVAANNQLNVEANVYTAIRIGVLPPGVAVE